MIRSKITLFIAAILVIPFLLGARFVLDWFGVGMAPFAAQAPIASDGIKMHEEFRVWRHCTFEVGLRLMHDRFGQFDAVLVEPRTLPWTMDLKLYRLADGSQQILHVNKQPTLYGKGSQSTTFNLDFEALPRGRYRIEVVGAEPPTALVGHNLEVFVQVRPKSTCGVRPSVDDVGRARGV